MMVRCLSWLNDDKTGKKSRRLVVCFIAAFEKAEAVS